MSLSSGIFPSPWKRALVQPVKKKGKSDHLDVKSFRHISNQSVLAKALEKNVSAQWRSL